MPDPAAQRAAIVAYAQSKLGDPYVWGATGPNAFDCSGLVDAAYNSVGANIGRPIASSLGKMGAAVSVGEAQIGDIVYFDEKGATDHVGIYIGNGKMIDAPHTGANVEIDSIAGYSSIRNVVGGSGSTGAGGVSGVIGGLASIPGKVAGGVWDGFAGAMGGVLAPIGRYIVDAFLVLTGVVLIIVALVLIAKAGDNDAHDSSSSSPAPANNGGGESRREEHGEHEREPGPGHELGGAGEGGAAEDAAVVAA